MKLLPSDPDVATIIGRIKNCELDLQPDFQRGEVWSDSKKRRLIDTILRDWHIPPIHVVERPESLKQEVLDGQQRLVAIRDFVNGLIRVDGSIEPIEEEIMAADKCTYETLPPLLRRRFDRFTIRVFRLVDFRPDEPGELFFRLNQPTSLTAAEQRNAFFGPVRQQVRMMCERFPDFGISDEVLGFSNSRMAFDDIVAKACLAIERGTLRQKLTASTITERYRSQQPFHDSILLKVESALQAVGRCVTYANHRVRFNKATLLSWLFFLSRLDIDKSGKEQFMHVSRYLTAFEEARGQARELSLLEELYDPLFPPTLLNIFTDRASLRVADVSSVILRDAILFYCFARHQRQFAGSHAVFHGVAERIYHAWKPLLKHSSEPSEAELLRVLDELEWGWFS